MFKSKWQKKYERAMNNIEFWIDYHKERVEYYTKCAEKFPKDTSDYNNINSIARTHIAQKIALCDILRNMESIKKMS